MFETAPSGARQEPETATKAVPAHYADAIKVALLRPGKVLHRSKNRFERTMPIWFIDKRAGDAVGSRYAKYSGP